jgi:hypothetical protein
MLSFLLRNVLFKQFFDVIRKGPIFLFRKCNQLGLQSAIDLQGNGSVFHLTADSTTETLEHSRTRKVFLDKLAAARYN